MQTTRYTSYRTRFSGLLLIVCVAGCKKNTSNYTVNNTATNTNTGVFTFTYAGFTEKPIRVFYHITSGGDKRTMPVLLLLHGDQRNAMDYRDVCIVSAINKQFLVFAPEFSEAGFPDAPGICRNIKYPV